MSEDRLNYYKEWIGDNEEIVVDSSIFEELVNAIDKYKQVLDKIKEYIKNHIVATETEEVILKLLEEIE